MARLVHNRTFLRLLCGRIVTNVGDSVYAIASMWLVYTLSGSSVYTGIAGAVLFATQPLQVVLGPLIDRLSFRRLLVGTQTLQLAGVVIMPLAYWYELLSVWLLIAVMGTLELCNQIVYPAQSALLPAIVAEENLARANAWFSVSYQGVDVVFNALGGVQWSRCWVARFACSYSMR